MSGAAKGSAYEREIAKQLSLWWSLGASDDLFWRSSQSGGRATSRAKVGKTTANACGDLCAQTKEGQDLLELFTIEIKRGYNTYTISDVLEKGTKGFNLFVAQAAKAAQLAGTPYWLLIHKRDRRPALVFTNCMRPTHITGNCDGIDFYLLDEFLSADMRQWINQVGQRRADR